MGYTTDFSGSFQLKKALTKDQAAYLKMFAETRRMKRDPAKIPTLPDAQRNQPCLDLLKKLGLPLGPEGAYYCGVGMCGQDGDDSVLDHNSPSSDQPGLWCQWIPRPDRKEIEWDGGEKFYEYVEWIKYIIENFLKPWGHVLNGQVDWVGEDSDDRGTITVKNNMVSTRNAGDERTIVEAVLEQKKILPTLLGIHPLLDERIAIVMGTSKGDTK